MRKEIQLETVINQALAGLKASIYVSMPGSIVSYDPATQTASVQPMINDIRTDLSDDSAFFEPWGILQNVPVAWPRCAGYVMTGFLQPNDQVVLETFDMDPTAWRAQGRSLSPTNPGSLRRLGGQHWRVNPTDLTAPNNVGVNASAPTAPGLVIGLDGGQTLIEIDGNFIKVGHAATDFVALASMVAAELGKIKLAIAGLSCAAAPGPVISSAPYTAVGNVAATIAKAK